MKNVIIALILALSSSLASAELTLDFLSNPDGTRSIIHNSDDWSFVTKAPTYSVYVDKSIVNRKQKQIEFHAITEFDKLQQYNQFPFEIKRIYSFGVLNCVEAKLYLLGDLFTDKDNVIRYFQSHDYGSYITNLGESAIAREVYNTVCGDTI
jgi:hypothetical protein